MNDGSLIWPKPAGVGRGREPVTPVGRQRSRGGHAAECTVGQKARADLGASATAISGMGAGTRESVKLREAMRAKVREIRGLLRAIGPGPK